MKFILSHLLLLSVFTLTFSATRGQDTEELSSPEDIAAYWFGFDLIDALLDHKYEYWEDAVSDDISFSWCKEKPDKIGCDKADFKDTYSTQLNADLRVQMESAELIFMRPIEEEEEVLDLDGNVSEKKELKMSFEWRYFDEDVDSRSVLFVFYSEKLYEPEWKLQSVILY